MGNDCCKESKEDRYKEDGKARGGNQHAHHQHANPHGPANIASGSSHPSDHYQQGGSQLSNAVSGPPEHYQQHHPDRQQQGISNNHEQERSRQQSHPPPPDNRHHQADGKKQKGKDKRQDKAENLEKENQQIKRHYQDLKYGYDHIQQDNQELRTNYEKLKEKKEKLEQNTAIHESAIKQYQQEEARIKQTINQLHQDNDELRNRLSSMAGAILTDNNPNIADLSDANRPTKLGEKYSELYDNEWTEAFQLLNEDVKLSEPESIRQLLSAFLKLNEICVTEAKGQYEQLTKAMAPFREGDSYSPEILKQLKDTRKRAYAVHLKRLQPHVDGIVRGILANHSVNHTRLHAFLMKCLELSWLMAIQDPPVYVDKRVDRAGEKLDKAEFKVYTQSGKYIEFVVWPTVYLHEGGPMLCKGVAQGRAKKNVKSTRVDVKGGSKTVPSVNIGKGSDSKIPNTSGLYDNASDNASIISLSTDSSQSHDVTGAGNIKRASTLDKQQPSQQKQHDESTKSTRQRPPSSGAVNPPSLGEPMSSGVNLQSITVSSVSQSNQDRTSVAKSTSGISSGIEKTQSSISHKQQQSQKQKGRAPEKPDPRPASSQYFGATGQSNPAGQPSADLKKQGSQSMSGTSSTAGEANKISYKTFMTKQVISSVDGQSSDARNSNTADPKSGSNQNKQATNVSTVVVRM